MSPILRGPHIFWVGRMSSTPFSLFLWLCKLIKDVYAWGMLLNTSGANEEYWTTFPRWHLKWFWGWIFLNLFVGLFQCSNMKGEKSTSEILKEDCHEPLVRPSNLDASLLWIHRWAIANCTVTCQEWGGHGLFTATRHCLPCCLVEATVFLSPSQAVWNTEAKFKQGLGEGALRVPRVESLLILYKKPQLCCSLVRELESEQGLCSPHGRRVVPSGESQLGKAAAVEGSEMRGCRIIAMKKDSEWKHLQGSITAALQSIFYISAVPLGTKLQGK